MNSLTLLTRGDVVKNLLTAVMSLPSNLSDGSALVPPEHSALMSAPLSGCWFCRYCLRDHSTPRSRRRLRRLDFSTRRLLRIFTFAHYPHSRSTDLPSLWFRLDRSFCPYFRALTDPICWPSLIETLGASFENDFPHSHIRQTWCACRSLDGRIAYRELGRRGSRTKQRLNCSVGCCTNLVFARGRDRALESARRGLL